MFIRTILALIDSITEVGDEAVGVRILDMVTLEDALVLVLTHPVSMATHLALVGDHGAGDGAATELVLELVRIQFVLEQIVICLSTCECKHCYNCKTLDIHWLQQTSLVEN